MSGTSVRAQVLTGLIDVSLKGRSAQDILPTFVNLADTDRRLAFELFYGCLHHYFEFQAAIKQRLQKPMKNHDADLRILLILGMYQLTYTRIADHAAINETVELCRYLKKPWATKLVNAILRRYQRDISKGASGKEEQGNGEKGQDKSEQLTEADRVNFPSWLYQQVATDWQNAQEIYKASHTRAPLTIRVNRKKTTIAEFQEALAEAEIEFSIHPMHSHAINLSRVGDVTKLPGYDDGWFSVQDAAAQFAASIIAADSGDRILDACAAPGGKTSHLLELADETTTVVALDNVESRLTRLQENMARLGLKADVRLGDALLPEGWHDSDEGLFDKILLDAPCSATGIIRRHPDITLHRKPKDIRVLTQLQWRMLKTMWSLLKPGGTLIYSTCSILKAENENMVADFIKHHDDAQLVPFVVGKTADEKPGIWQILPGEEQMDGFFYAKIEKAE